MRSSWKFIELSLFSFAFPSMFYKLVRIVNINRWVTFRWRFRPRWARPLYLIMGHSLRHKLWKHHIYLREYGINYENVPVHPFVLHMRPSTAQFEITFPHRSGLVTHFAGRACDIDPFQDTITRNNRDREELFFVLSLPPARRTRVEGFCDESESRTGPVRKGRAVRSLLRSDAFAGHRVTGVVKARTSLTCSTLTEGPLMNSPDPNRHPPSPRDAHNTLSLPRVSDGRIRVIPDAPFLRALLSLSLKRSSSAWAVVGFLFSRHCLQKYFRWLAAVSQSHLFVRSIFLWFDNGMSRKRNAPNNITFNSFPGIESNKYY